LKFIGYESEAKIEKLSFMAALFTPSNSFTRNLCISKMPQLTRLVLLVLSLFSYLLFFTTTSLCTKSKLQKI